MEEVKAVPEPSEGVTEIKYDEVVEYIQVFDEVEEEVTEVKASGCLTKSGGVYQGPSGKETYYNLDMSGVISIMRDMGYSESDYPYWVRNDGVKMLGEYVIVAADFSIRPRGTILESSLGTAIVCDTGGFANYNSSQLDIAVSW